jgi:hypothetical protein
MQAPVPEFKPQSHQEKKKKERKEKEEMALTDEDEVTHACNPS